MPACRFRPMAAALLVAATMTATPASAEDAPARGTGPIMSIDGFTRSIRDTYVDQFRAYAESRNGPEAGGATEIKIEVNQSQMLFRRLICVDFIRQTADGLEPEMFAPERQLSFDPFEAEIGGVTIAFSSFGWDGVDIRYASAKTPEEIFGAWFEYWFDPDEKRLDTNNLLNGNIHNIVIVEGGVSIDMGTAPPEAFHELIEAFGKAGITRIEIGTRT